MIDDDLVVELTLDATESVEQEDMDRWGPVSFRPFPGILLADPLLPTERRDLIGVTATTAKENVRKIYVRGNQNETLLSIALRESAAAH